VSCTPTPQPGAADRVRRSLGPTPDRAGAIVELVQGPCQPARVLLAPADPFELQQPPSSVYHQLTSHPLTCRIEPPRARAADAGHYQPHPPPVRAANETGTPSPTASTTLAVTGPAATTTSLPLSYDGYLIQLPKPVSSARRHSASDEEGAYTNDLLFKLPPLLPKPSPPLSPPPPLRGSQSTSPPSPCYHHQHQHQHYYSTTTTTTTTHPLKMQVMRGCGFVSLEKIFVHSKCAQQHNTERPGAGFEACWSEVQMRYFAL